MKSQLRLFRQSVDAVVVGQALLCALVLVVATLYPRSGSTGLAIPILPTARAGGLAWLSHEGVAILSPSTDARFYLVHTPSNLTALRALGHGVILIAVPSALCSPQDK